jgi:hypothetical protein
LFNEVVEPAPGYRDHYRLFLVSGLRCSGTMERSRGEHKDCVLISSCSQSYDL